MQEKIITNVHILDYKQINKDRCACATGVRDAAVATAVSEPASIISRERLPGSGELARPTTSAIHRCSAQHYLLN